MEGGGFTARILIVDDEDPILFAMADYFSAHGYEVDCAHDRREAEGLLECADYAVVITDLRLDRHDEAEGLSIAQRVGESFPGTRCIVLTAYGSPEAEAAARAKGVDAFLQKPVALLRMAEIVSGLIASPPSRPIICSPRLSN